MLTKTFEWMRIADPKPDDASVASRTKAVGDLLNKLGEKGAAKLCAQMTIAALIGPLSGPKPDETFTELVISTIRKYQPAFPASVSENALDLRATCAITLGEVIAATTAKPRPQALRTVAAAAFLAGTGIRPKESGKYLVAMVDELHTAAAKFIQQRAVAIRERADISFDELDSIEPPSAADFATSWTSLKAFLKNALDQLRSDAETDREELEVLWWFYNNRAVGANKPLSDLSPADAAVVAAVEIADRVSLPPHGGIEPLIAEAVNRGRKKPDLRAQSVEQLMTSLAAANHSLLASGGDSSSGGQPDYAALFPLTWISKRVVESGVAEGWASEFEGKTGLPASLALSPAELAAQVFRERVGRRRLAEEAQE
jgi:hypothetical protein